jgi:hypothetical protein
LLERLDNACKKSKEDFVSAVRKLRNLAFSWGNADDLELGEQRVGIFKRLVSKAKEVSAFNQGLSSRSWSSGCKCSLGVRHKILLLVSYKLVI